MVRLTWGKRLTSTGTRPKVDTYKFYSDSDHAGDRPATTRSQTGMVFFLNQVPVYWASRKQVQGTAVSSAMAEIYAMADTVRCARLFKWRCEDMGMTIKGPIVLEIDNTQARCWDRTQVSPANESAPLLSTCTTKGNETPSN